MRESQKGYIAAILYSTIIGFSFLAVKVAQRSAGTPALLAHRFTAAVLGLLFVVLIRKIDVRIRLRDFWSIFPLGICYPILYFGLQSAGLEHTSSSMAGILQASGPVFSAVLAALILKEKAGRRQIAGILLTVVGVASLSLRNGLGSSGQVSLGSIFLILSALAFGFYNVFSRKLSRRYPVFTLTFWMLLIGLVGFYLYALLMGSVKAGFFAPLAESPYLLSILYLGILSSLASSYLSNFALARIEATKMSVFGSLATLISVVAGIVILKEPFQLSMIFGMGLIITGVLLVNRAKR